MQIRIGLSRELYQSVLERLQRAYESGHLRLIKRIHAVLYFVDGKSVAEIATVLHLGAQTVRDYLAAFVLKKVESFQYKRPPGRPLKLSKTQRKELAELITAGPQAAGYTSACWTAVMVQDLILQHFHVEYHPHYIANLLDQLGFSFQKARFVSDHLSEAARVEWLQTTWPAIRQLALEKQALLLFGDEASFAQWGSLSYTWALKGQQPTVKTSGQRKGYKVFGLIDFFSGRLFWKSQTGRFNTESYSAFLGEVLTQTNQHIILIQDGAKYHTSRAMQDFFAAHADRLTKCQLPAYSPDFNPIEALWKKVKKEATHLKYFATFEALTKAVDATLADFADLPDEILSLMGRYCETLGAES